jgi:hypothetical protein
MVQVSDDSVELDLDGARGGDDVPNSGVTVGFVVIDSNDAIRAESSLADHTTQLSEVKIQILSTRTKHTGSKKFVEYVISVVQPAPADGKLAPYPSLGATWNVLRRYSEFAALNKKCKEYCSQLKAKLPGKKAFGNLDEETIEQRRKGLIVYLMALLEEKVALGNRRLRELIWAFLHPSDGSDGHTFKTLARSASFVRGIGKSTSPKKGGRHGAPGVPQDMRRFINSFLVTHEDVEESRLALQPATFPEYPAAEPFAHCWDGGTVTSDKVLLALSSASSKVGATAVAEAGFSGEAAAPSANNSGAAGGSSVNVSNRKRRHAGGARTMADCVFNVAAMLAQRMKRFWLVRWALAACRLLFGATLEWTLQAVVAESLAEALSEASLVEYLELLKEALEREEPSPEATAAEVLQSDCRMREAVLSQIPPSVQKALWGEKGPKPGGEGLDLHTALDCFQNPTYNRQILFVLVDSFLKMSFK